MTTKEALRLISEETIPEKTWLECERVLLKDGICPACAADGARSILGPHQEGSPEEYAGRWCYNCEQFFPDANQARGIENEDYGGAIDGMGNVFSDADPGL